ncbi:MAG: adenylate/guanylate cyclase domain-containing protein [Alphaproteobacteria bacterium]
MAEERVQRRLAAILAADVVGYSRMMGRDEAGTLARLKSLRADFLHPKVAEYGGRIVKTTGDGTLIEFGSAVDAVSHAVDVQRGMAERNAGLPEGEQIWLRLGINVGDIIIDGDDIYGDGVNVAARLEALAEPGGVCISDRVHDYVGDRLDIACEDLGRQTVKNIAEPVHVYRIRLGDVEATSTSGPQGTLPLPDKPSIAVLPFEDLSADRDQEYFADGIAEDIITALSRNRGVFVIARNSSFTYKGAAVDVKRIGQQLGVRYVLEGSVRKAGNRVRITAQLIDAASGNHVWAERYDRELEDIFAVQDEITQNIVAALGSEVASAEIQRARRKDPSSLDAWDYTMRATWHFARATHEDMGEARRLALRAIELDSGNAAAFSILAFARPVVGMKRWNGLPRPCGSAPATPSNIFGLCGAAMLSFRKSGTTRRPNARD